MSYAIFDTTIAAVQTTKQSLVRVKVGILLRVEYQSCAECYNDHARQNSAFLHKKLANYGAFVECRLAANTAK
jgi:hypothetical protein